MSQKRIKRKKRSGHSRVPYTAQYEIMGLGRTAERPEVLASVGNIVVQSRYQRFMDS